MAFLTYEMAFVEPIRRASVEVSLAPSRSGRERVRSRRSTFERRRTLACMSSLLMQKFHDGRS